MSRWADRAYYIIKFNLEAGGCPMSDMVYSNFRAKEMVDGYLVNFGSKNFTFLSILIKNGLEGSCYYLRGASGGIGEDWTIQPQISFRLLFCVWG